MKWTKQEEDYLRGNPSQTDIDVGKKLGRTQDQVRNKRKRMGLTTVSLSSVKAKIEITPDSVREDVNKIIAKQKESDIKKLKQFDIV